MTAEINFRVFLQNSTPYNLTLIESDLAHGDWTDPWYPHPNVAPNTVIGWQSESGGIMTGTEGHVRYRIMDGGSQPVIYIHWDNPYWRTEDSYHFNIEGDGGWTNYNLENNGLWDYGRDPGGVPFPSPPAEPVYCFQNPGAVLGSSYPKVTCTGQNFDYKHVITTFTISKK